MIHQRLPLDRAPLKSFRELAFLLGVPLDELRRLASELPNQYKPFMLAKASKPYSRQVSTPKLRQIDNPSRALKLVQSRIRQRLLVPLSSPEFLYGAIRKQSVRTHAGAHLRSLNSMMVKMDIKAYYPSLTNAHIFRVWSNVLGCSPRVARLLTQLTTFEHRLPQGAPTSPALANLFIASIYGPVLNACREKGVTATVWVDDLTFSGPQARAMMELVRQTLAASGLKDSRGKRKILNSVMSKVVTGVRIGRGRIRACKLKARDIRAGIHHLAQGHVTDRGLRKDIESLRGKIAHIRSICPRDALPLERQLEVALECLQARSIEHPTLVRSRRLLSAVPVSSGPRI